MEVTGFLCLQLLYFLFINFVQFEHNVAGNFLVNVLLYGPGQKN